MTVVHSDRLGLLGIQTSPVAQLLQDLPEEARTHFLQVNDPADDAARVDRILVLSQDDALAHLPTLMRSKKPCRILLRRAGDPDEAVLWHTGITLLAKALGQVDWPQMELVALTEEAAKSLSSHIDMPVGVIGALPAIPGKRPRVALKRGEDLLTFALDASDGGRETRRASLSIFNWARLRRLANPIAADENDLDLNDLTTFARGGAAPSMPVIPRNTPRCLVAVVPNGVGLGHVTRMMAIGKALQKSGDIRIVFWSYSRAAEILQAAGFEVVIRQNPLHLKAHPPSWREWETLEFANTLRQLGATLISYDGGTFDPFIRQALRQPGCGHIGVVWVRRGMYRADTDPQLLEAEQFCDLIVEPGDLAQAVDMGPTRTKQAVYRGFCKSLISQPVTLKPYLPSYSKKEAKKRLKLRRGRHCLVSLGGAFGDWSVLRDQIEQSAKAHKVHVVWAQSPLAPPPTEGQSTAQVRRFYPLSRYLDAFDGMITATGYNSYHELMLGYDGPVLLAPTNNVRLDDQVGRAKWAGDQGWAHVVLSDQHSENTAIIDRFMQEVRSGLRHKNRPQATPGDDEIAAAFNEIFDRYSD